jgi:hypothetical protein
MIDLQRVASDSVLETHPHYRTAVGVLGVALPPTLVGVWLLVASTVESSISAYYHTSTRDWFVGTLWVIGFFLFFYTYRPSGSGEARSAPPSVRTGHADAWLGKAAGVCAVLVALLPTDPPPATKDAPPVIGWLHGAAAAVLFLCLSLFPLLLFSQSRTHRNAYLLYGRAMLAFLLLTVAYVFAPEGVKTSIAPLRPILFLETALILLFGASWFHKGWDMSRGRP